MAGVDLSLAVVRTCDPACLLQGLPLLAASFPREDGVHLSIVTTALRLLSVISIGWLSYCCITLFLIVFRKVVIEWGQSPLKNIEGLQWDKKSVSIEPEAEEEHIKHSTSVGAGVQPGMYDGTFSSRLLNGTI
jgi:hypothetical protein